jgi:hypothetical protein
MPAKTSSTPAPPPAAVAADAHWAATRERLRNRARPIATMTICDDLDVKRDLEVARFALRRAKEHLADTGGKDAKDAADAAQADVDAAEAAFNEAAIVLRFQAMRRSDFEDLKAAHPPTEEQAENDFMVNVDTIGPELIAACSLDGITVDDAKTFLEEWGEGEAAALFNTCWSLQSDTRMDLGKG